MSPALTVKEIALMRRILMLMTVVALMAVMLAMSAAPALAVKPDIPGDQKHQKFEDSQAEENAPEDHHSNIFRACSNLSNPKGANGATC